MSSLLVYPHSFGFTLFSVFLLWGIYSPSIFKGVYKYNTQTVFHPVFDGTGFNVLQQMKNTISLNTKNTFMQHLLRRISLPVLLAGFAITSFAQDSGTMTTTGTTATITATSVPASPKLFSGTSGYRVWSFGLTGGGLGPAVAIGGRNDFNKWKATLGYGAYLKAQLSHHFGLQLEFLKGTVEGENTSQPADPYKSFKTDINWSGALKGVFTLANINWSQMHTAVQPYVGVGFGLINYNPTLVTQAGANVDYKTDGSITERFIPIDIGLKFNVSRNVNLELGYSMNFVDGDNFDGFYKAPVYNVDKFSYGHVGVEFALGDKSKPQLATHNAPAALAQDLWDKNAALASSLASTQGQINKLNSDIAALNSLKDELARMKMDSDGDGVPDAFDKCPNTPAGTKVDGSGCALPTPPPPTPAKQDTTIVQKFYITEEDKRVVNEAIRNLEFDFGKSTIRARSLPYLQRVADILRQKGFSLKLAGHTDNVGSDAANMKLSKDRAESVKATLVSQGANPSRIEATGYGESQPIATNKTDAGRQKNRRVEFTLF
jgi:OOP family OmpA-OmpF porin